jgi:uncharacterized repeat protein (TIGR02543 family)
VFALIGPEILISAGNNNAGPNSIITVTLTADPVSSTALTLTPTFAGTTASTSYTAGGLTDGAVTLAADATSTTFTLTIAASGFTTGQTIKVGLEEGTGYTVGESATITLTTTSTYTVTYNGNDNTGGSAPTDASSYAANAPVTVLGVASLTRTGKVFDGWNTQADGSGTSYAAGATLTMGSQNVTLYAKWRDPGVSYYSNNATGGNIPASTASYAAGTTVTVLGNTANLVRTNYAFYAWNTAADGTGTTYAGSATFAMPGTDVGLYAMWSAKRNWEDISIASDASGTFMAAVVNDGGVYRSTDSGASWTLLSAAGTRYWKTVAISKDGQKIIAGESSGHLWYSSNSGATWTELTNAGTHSWTDVTLFDLDQRIAAVYAALTSGNNDDGVVVSNTTIDNVAGNWHTIQYAGTAFYSIAGGDTAPGLLLGGKDSSNAALLRRLSFVSLAWNNPNMDDAIIASPPSLWFNDVALSADATKAIASTGQNLQPNQYLYSSTDSAANFAALASGQKAWTSVAASSDGYTIVAIAEDNSTGSVASGAFRSTNSGANWSQLTNLTVSGYSWKIRSSHDGTELLAAQYNGQLYRSTDSGASCYLTYQP